MWRYGTYFWTFSLFVFSIFIDHWLPSKGLFLDAGQIAASGWRQATLAGHEPNFALEFLASIRGAGYSSECEFISDSWNP